MVFTSAFEKTVAYGSISNSQSYFYDELWKINQKSKESNASVIVELKKFSKRTENKEFIRVVNVISDNINRGTELVRAMQTESELLSYQRRKRAEERARVAETKLTIPLAMQLLSLILITLAPAMFDM
jgi:type II secretion system protein F domain protein